PAANTAFKRLQIFSSLGLALSHGTNDAQKTMGIITLTMLIIIGSGVPVALPGWMTDDGALHQGLAGTASAFTAGQFTNDRKPEVLRTAVAADFPAAAADADPVAALNALVVDDSFAAAWTARKGATVTLDTATRQLLATVQARAADSATAAAAAVPGTAGTAAMLTAGQQTARLNRLLLEETYGEKLCPQLAGNFYVPHWVIIACSLAIALGISSGGWTIIKTLGGKLFKVQPINGFASQAASGLVIYIAAVTGFPVSTTQIVSSSIMGSGAAERPKAVRWGVIGNILMTWFITIPGAAAIGAAAYYLIRILIVRA
ncbi:MAG TPA: inorganic phosphate transporter, partial [bacterium]|nr:inorganic phosphate transporter [bacterium]